MAIECSRRFLLRSSAPALGAVLGGCFDSMAAGGPDPQPCTADPADYGRTGVFTRAVVPTPVVEGTSQAAGEIVIVRTLTEPSRDLSGYTLVYCGRWQYPFPDLVSEVGPAGDVVVHTGTGTNEFSPANEQGFGGRYDLYVGHDEPLLDDGGMRLVLRDSSGSTVDSVEYDAVGEGGVWER